jgi:hypothetical protein
MISGCAAAAAVVSESISGVPRCETNAIGRSSPSMAAAPRSMPTPRSVKIRGGLVMLVRAATSSAGTPESLRITRRIRTGAGAFSIVIRLCTPSESAEAYSIGFRFQFCSVSCSSSQPSMMPSRIFWSTRSSGVS